MTKRVKARRDNRKACKPGGRKVGVEINFVLFQSYESSEINFSSKISSFTVCNFFAFITTASWTLMTILYLLTPQWLSFSSRPCSFLNFFLIYSAWQVKCWIVPDGGLTENMTESAVDLLGHQRRVGVLSWHPTAENVLASAGYDYMVRCVTKCFFLCHSCDRGCVCHSERKCQTNVKHYKRHKRYLHV